MNLEKSMREHKDKAESLHWMPVIFRHSGNTALKCLIMFYVSMLLHGLRKTSKNCLFTQFRQSGIMLCGQTNVNVFFVCFCFRTTDVTSSVLQEGPYGQF